MLRHAPAVGHRRVAEDPEQGGGVSGEPVGEPRAAEPEPQRAPADLMAALQESLNKARGNKKPRAASEPKAAEAKAKA